MLDKDSMQYCVMMLEDEPLMSTRLPSGTADTMQGFIAAMKRVLEGLESFTCAYVDDLLVVSRSKHQHLADIESVLSRIKEVNITLRLEKCHFFQERVGMLLRISV